MPKKGVYLNNNPLTNFRAIATVYGLSRIPVMMEGSRIPRYNKTYSIRYSYNLIFSSHNECQIGEVLLL